MSGPQFFQTATGRAFFEGTMPRLYRAVNRLADALSGPREYKMLRVSNPVTVSDEDELNKYGKEGWRIAHATQNFLYLERVVPRKEGG